MCPSQQTLEDWITLANNPAAPAILDPVFKFYKQRYSNLHNWEFALANTSRAILSLLVLKELAIVFAVGFSRYFKTGPHVIDFVITVVAWSLELNFAINEKFIDGNSAMLFVLLAWRVLRLLHILLENIAGNLRGAVLWP